MRVLWAPWRMAYIAGPKPTGCIFCAAAHTQDLRSQLILLQRPALVMLNRFPYSSAHLMVAPQRHTAAFGALAADELQAVMETVQRSARILEEALRPDGMNIGINLGLAAGAGIADHLHWHIVPRWVGDTNFMPMLAEVRVMPQHLEQTYDLLQPLFAALRGT